MSCQNISLRKRCWCPQNPFAELLLASEQILALEGGRELLKIAVKPCTTEAQKLAMVMQLPPTEARQLLIDAHFAHKELVKTLRTETDFQLGGGTVFNLNRIIIPILIITLTLDHIR